MTAGIASAEHAELRVDRRRSRQKNRSTRMRTEVGRAEKISREHYRARTITADTVWTSYAGGALQTDRARAAADARAVRFPDRWLRPRRSRAAIRPWPRTIDTSPRGAPSPCAASGRECRARSPRSSPRRNAPCSPCAEASAREVQVAEAAEKYTLRNFVRLEAGRLQMRAQLLEAAPANESDRTGRESQPPRELVVRERRLLIEQHLYERAAPLGQLRHGFPQRLRALHVLEDPRAGPVGERELVFHVRGLRPSGFTPGARFPVKRLVARDAHQPRPHRL